MKSSWPSIPRFPGFYQPVRKAFEGVCQRAWHTKLISVSAGKLTVEPLRSPNRRHRACAALAGRYLASQEEDGALRVVVPGYERAKRKAMRACSPTCSPICRNWLPRKRRKGRTSCIGTWGVFCAARRRPNRAAALRCRCSHRSTPSGSASSRKSTRAQHRAAHGRRAQGYELTGQDNADRNLGLQGSGIVLAPCPNFSSDVYASPAGFIRML